MHIEERVEKLEQELALACRHRRWLVGILLTVGAAAVVAAALSVPCTPIALAQAGSPDNVLRARGFVLFDENGKSRASLSVTKDGPALNLLDEKGERRASVAALKGGSMLALYDENGKTRAVLSVTKDGPNLILADENSKPIRIIQ